MRYENDDDASRRHDGRETLNAPNRATEAMLAGLAPALGSVDPVAAGFAAAQRAAWQAQRRQMWAWRAAAAVAVVGMGLSWIVPLSSSSSPSSSPSRDSRVVQGSFPQPTVASVGPMTATPTLPADSILSMQRAVAKEGLAGLGVPHVPAPSRTVRDADLF